MSCEVVRLGTVPYLEALELQSTLHARRAAGEIGDTLLLLEHPHVYTIGRRGSRSDVLLDTEALTARGVDVIETDRGGQVTYHGPGQLVGYPIVDLGPAADLLAYVRCLERVMVATLEHFDLQAAGDPACTGVWIDDAKIGAIGVRVTRSITKHGFALNVGTDLSYFAGIVPCGISDRGVTSMANELDTTPSMDDVMSATQEAFASSFRAAGV